MATISKIRAEFDARQAQEAMYALSVRARFLNNLLAEQRKRWEEAGDLKVKDSIEANIKRLETEVAAVEKLNRTISKSFETESAFQQVLNHGAGSMSVARLETAQRNARAIMRNINPQDELAIDQMEEAQNVMNATGKQLASLKNGFRDAMETVRDGVEMLALPELKRLETALTEAQKFSANQREWNEYEEAIGRVRLEMQRAGKEAVEMEEKNAKLAASLKYGFDDAFQTFEQGIDGMALPELKRLEAALTESQKYSMDATEWQKYGAAIDTVRQKVQGITGEYLSVKDAMGYAEQIGRQTFTGTIADLERAKKLLTDYRKTIKLTADGSEELKRVDKSLEVIEQQLKGTYLTTEKFNEILKSPKGKSFNELKAAIEQAEKQLYGMRRETNEEREAFLQLREQIENAKRETKEFGDAQEDAGISMDDLKQKAKELAGAYLGLQGFQKVWELNLNLSDQMAAVRKTTGFSADEVARLSENIKAIDTRATNEQLMALAATAGQVGLQTQEEVLGFTKAANQITVSLDELGEEGVLQLMKVAQVSGALRAEGGDVESTLLKVGSAINELSAASSATAAPITDFIGRVGGVASTAKMTMAQIAALGATTDALAISEELAGTQINVFIGGLQKNTKAVADLLGTTDAAVQEMLDNGKAMDLFVQVVDKMGSLNASELDKFLKEMGSSGSRATQVFSTLSQNVEQLRANLKISNDAYEQGISITEEYNKVNDTAAGKFERLKNQIAETFTSDNVQRSLGWIIDRLRDLINLLTGNSGISVALRTIIIYLGLVRLQIVSVVSGALKSLGSGLKNIGIMLGFIKGEMTAMQWGNIFTAAAVAALYLIDQLRTLYKEAHQVETIVSEVMSKYATELDNATKKSDKMFESVGNARVAVKDANEEVKKAEEALKQAKKALDEGTGSTEKLEEAETNLKVAHEKVTRANLDHKSSIEQINREYSPYLGYMLSEISTAAELANARELINAKLRETILLKQQEAGYQRIEGAFGEKRDEQQQDIYDLIGENVTDPERAARMRKEIIDLVKQAKDGSKTILDIRKEWNRIYKEGGAKFSVGDYQGMEGYIWRLVTTEREIQDAKRLIDENVKADIKAARVGTKNTKGTQQELQDQLDAIYIGDKGKNNGLKQLQQQYEQADAKTRKQRAANLLKQMDAYESLIGNAQNFYDLQEKDEEASYKKLINNSDQRMKGLRSQREKLLKEAGDAYKPIQNGNGGGGGPYHNGSNSPTPYGTYNRITSPYIDWDADALVSRRKEMLERVRALANGADVQAVLSEDAKFITEATRKNIKTTRDAIEWYNTERLKIQDALHEKHLTNTGDWMDPKKGAKRASKMVQDEIKYYLDELDAYYTERKAKIQEAQNNEEISEAEARNRTLANEAEWQQRRGELQQLYSKKRKEVVKEEADAIYNIISERTGDSIGYIKSDINNTIKFIEKVGTEKGKPAMDRIYGDIDLGMERSFLRQRNAIGQHMKDITAIINKENPYVGITEELRKNLGTMDALLTDIEKDEERTVDKEIERTMFILEQSTKGYALTWEELMREMGKRGWQAWADAVNGDTQTQERLMHQVYRVFEKVQDAIKKEASQLKKEADIMWSNILLPGGDGKTTIKDAFEQTIGALGIEEGRVSRANSLIGAGQASERVADRLAIQQMKVQLAMQQYQYSLVRKIGREKIESLRKEAREAEAIGDIEKARQARMQAQNAEMALNLATRKEQTEELKQQDAIIAKTEESQNRLYTAMKEWADLLSSSLQSVFEATHAGDAEYFNERAKLNLTGKGGPGAGTYIVIDNEGTSDATAHYEYLNEREALERQREIANQNALADALKKALDDINMKMSEQITDWINASLQTASIDANTQAVVANTEALYETAGEPAAKPQGTVAAGGNGRAAAYGEGGGEWMPPMEMPEKEPGAEYMGPWTKWAEVSSKATETMVNNNKKVEKSTKASFAAMTAAANMYGIAYQAMSNENLSTAQKVEMMIVQAAGQAAISMLTASLAASEGETAANAPSWISKTLKELGPIGGPVAVGVFTALIGGLMGLATSKITKSKSEIAQVTGASHASAGRLSTGMLQYAEGNVNEFTDPSTLQTGKQYNVDAADGRTYRARFMGKGAKTHITHGPEFHLVGEAGREAIIDAKTTQNIRMNEPEIWRTIQVLSGGGRISAMRRRGRGVAAFADGNMDEMGGVGDMGNMGGTGMSAELTASLQASLDRNSDIMERIATEGIKGIFDVYGKDGLVETYDRGKKTMSRYGKRY